MTTDPIAAALPVCDGISYQLAIAGYFDASDYILTDYMRGYVAATLADALEAERAKVAAAYEAAACVTVDMGPRYDGRSVHYHIPEKVKGAVRALTPADAQAALGKLLAEARAEGWRAGRDAAARSCFLSGQDLAEGDWGPEGRAMAVMLEDRIRARPEPKEASHD